MTQKSFKLVRMITAFFLALIVSQAVVFDNYVLAVAAIFTGIAVLFISKKKVKGVIADERDYEMSGKAARLSLNIFSIIGAITSFIFMAMRETSYVYEITGSVIAYSVCALLLMYSIIFRYYEKQN